MGKNADFLPIESVAEGSQAIIDTKGIKCGFETLAGTCKRDDEK